MHIRTTGKLQRLVAQAAAIEPSTILSRDPGENKKTLFITDDNTKIDYLIDTGAEFSVLPPGAEDVARGARPTNVEHLLSANGSIIPIYGRRTVILTLNGVKYEHSFVVAGVTKEIIGCDFLFKTGLMVDIKNARLWRSRDNERIPCQVRSVEYYTYRVYSMETNSEKYLALLREFPQVIEPLVRFKEPCHPVQHSLEVTRSPFRHKFRPLSPEKEAIAKKEFLDMERMGVVRRGHGQWASPLHMVKKTNGSWRPCGDYRHLNSITRHDSYPLPRIASMTNRLAGATIFTKLDLVRAYHQIPMAPEDVEKTAINTPFGLWEFVRMPFGLRNSAQSFQRFIDSITADLDFCFAYLDDILIASENEEQHLEHLRKVMERLAFHGIIVNPGKCEFGKTSIQFLGHIVSAEGIRPIPSRIEVLQNYPLPNRHKELRRFLGLVNFYHRFIPHCANLTKPFHHLLPKTNKKTNGIINWSFSQKQAFSKLREQLAKIAVLTFPKRGLPTRICTDASDTATGAVLEQLENGQWRPLGFHSKTLRPQEQKFSAFDRELLAMHLAVKHFRPFVEGCKFHIVTDHKPLCGSTMTSMNNSLTAKQLRWWCFITEFTTDIRHVSGSTNVVADALSRICALSSTEEFSRKLAIEQEKDSSIGPLFRERPADCPFTVKTMYGSPLIGIMPTDSQSNFRPIVPPSLQQEVIKAYHDLAHAGIKATQKLVKDNFLWSGMSTDITEFVRNCSACQQSKVYRKNKSPLQAFLPPAGRFTDIHVDIVGPLPQCRGYEYLFTTVDRFTRYPVAIPMRKATAEDCARALLEGWIQHFGVPCTIVSDRGRQFESSLWAELSRFLGIHHQTTTAYHPQSNGMVERMHRQMKDALRTKLNKEDWVGQLPLVMLGIRAAVKEDMQCSPAQMVYGGSPRLPRCLVFSEHKEKTQQTYLNKLQEIMNKLTVTNPKWHGTRKSQQLRELSTCTHVYVEISRIKKPLEHQYQGPFFVTAKHDKFFTINRDGKIENVSMDRLIPARMSSSGLKEGG
jgi:cleavage and polyadenylation specificity factor subunit 1